MKKGRKNKKVYYHAKTLRRREKELNQEEKDSKFAGPAPQGILYLSYLF